MSEASQTGSSAAGEERCLGGAMFRAVEVEGESHEVKQRRQMLAHDSMSQRQH